MNTKTTLRRRAAALGLALIMCAACAVPASAAEDATAAAMRLTKTTGTVDVTNSRGRELSLRDDMRLYSGYHVETQETSYAWISLDNTKLTKLDAVSELEVRKAGKELELLLNSGQLYFNVTEPLNSDESLSIRTSTMVTGIRGTSGWVRVVDQWHTQVYVLQGRVECSVTDPVTGQTKTTLLTGGDMAECVVYEQVRPGDKCDIIRKGFTEEDAGGFIQVELAPDKPHRDRIEADSGLVFPDSLEKAEDRLKQDETDTHEKLQPIEDSYSHQDHTISKDPVWEENLDNDDSSDSDSGGSSEPEPNRPLIYTSMAPVTDDIVDGWLAEDQCAGVELSGSYTLVVDSGIHVPAGKSLTLNSGIPLEIYSGQTLQVDGTATVNEQIRSQGTIVVRSGNTLNALGGIESENGSLETTASGRVVLGGTGMVGLGTIINAGTIQGNVTFSSGSFTNTGTHAGGTITCDSGGAAYTPAVNVNGGSVDSIVGGSGAEITVSGGSVGELTMNAGADYARINGGNVGTGGIYQRGGTVNISAGTVSGPCVSVGTGTAGGGYSFALINSGVLEEGLTLSDGATAILEGGTVRNGATARLSSELEVAGAEVYGGIDVDTGSSLVISSGAVNGEVRTLGTSRISGGRLNDGIEASGPLTTTGGEIHQGSANYALQVTSGTVSLDGAILYANSRDEMVPAGQKDRVYFNAGANRMSDLEAVIYKPIEGGEVMLKAIQTSLDLTAGEAGDTIVMCEGHNAVLNFDSTTTLSAGTPDRPVTLELNGNELNLNRSAAAAGSMLDIAGGHYIIDGSKSGSQVHVSSPLNPSNVAIGLSDSGGSSSLTLNGGAYTLEGSIDAGPGTSLTVKGDTQITGSLSCPISGGGGTVTITDNAVVSTVNENAILYSDRGTINVSGNAQITSSGEATIVLDMQEGSMSVLNVSGGIISNDGNGAAVLFGTHGAAFLDAYWSCLNYTGGTIRTMAANTNMIVSFMASGGSDTDPAVMTGCDFSNSPYRIIASSGYTTLGN